MKTILLMRHAKSSWDDTNLADHDRPLNKRGKRDAPRMGALLKQLRIVPDLIVSSTAKRARNTAETVRKSSGFKPDVALEADLYLAGPSQMMRIIQSLPEEADSAMLVAHNPGMEEMLEALTGECQALPTAAVAQIALPDVEKWRQARLNGRGQLMDIWRPKEVNSK